MQKIEILNDLVLEVEEVYPTLPLSEQLEVAATLWRASNRINSMLSQAKDMMREEGLPRQKTSSGHFRISGSSDRYQIKASTPPDKIESVRKSLGAYWDMLFQHSYRTKPKFQEVFSELSDDQKALLFGIIEQKTTKGRITFVKN